MCIENTEGQYNSRNINFQTRLLVLEPTKSIKLKLDNLLAKGKKNIYIRNVWENR